MGGQLSLRRDLTDCLQDRPAVDAELPLDEEAVRFRILALLKGRGAVQQRRDQALFGFHRLQVYRLVKGLEAEGKVQLAGKGRSAHVVLSEKS